MDWRAIDFDWNRARAFLVTAEEGSLSAAATALDMAQPTLGRQVRALEAELGVALFERVGRGLELTPTGLDLLEHVRVMADAAGKLSLAASGQSDSIAGSVCISATEVMAAYVLPPIINDMRRSLPGVEFELVASNDESDLRRRETDIAIRGFRPTQPDLIARKLRDVSAYLYAAPKYLQQLGSPTSVTQLSDAVFIGLDDSARLIRLLAERAFTLSERNFPVVTKSRIVQWELVKCGAGIGIMPATIGDAEPLVCRVLDLEPFNAELWIVTHRELRTNRRIRTVFDHLVEALSG